MDLFLELNSLQTRRSMVKITPVPPSSPSGMTLVKTLVNVAQLVAGCELPKVCQRRNAANISRRIRLVSPLFEEILDTRTLVPPSAALAFRELHVTMQKVKLLLDDTREGSCIWLLMESSSVAAQFHQLTQEFAVHLGNIPLDLLELSDEVKEQVEFLHMQVKRAKLSVDATEEQLGEEVILHLKAFEKKGATDTEELRVLFQKLNIFSSRDFQREIQHIDEYYNSEEAHKSAEMKKSIATLFSFVRYSQRVLLGGTGLAADYEENDFSSRESSATFDVGEVSTSGMDATVLDAAMIPPDEFRCPISLDLMYDPVIVASGQSYDREYIQKWLESGAKTCPKSGQELAHGNLITNYALRSIINQWCQDNHIPLEKSGSKTGAGSHIAKIAHYLVEKLATGTPDVQKQSAYELRLLAKCSMDSRMYIGNAGAIPFLVSLLSSNDSKTQENAVTALLNLSIYANNKILIKDSGALDSIIEVLRAGLTMEAKENAAATIFSLAALDELKVTIGENPSAIPSLVKLLQSGTLRGKKDAIQALFNLSVYMGNKAKVVAAGAVPLLVSLLINETSLFNVEDPAPSTDFVRATDEALAVLALLAGCQEGLLAIVQTSAMSVLVNLLREHGTPRGNENSISVLLALCRGGGDNVIQGLTSLHSVGLMSSLYTSLTTGTPRAKRKASSLLKIIHRWEN